MFQKLKYMQVEILDYLSNRSTLSSLDLLKTLPPQLL
jgi:hypothetical protein